MSKFELQRRNFLKSCLSKSVAGAGAYASLSSLGMMNTFAQTSGDYKALVCLFLFGGNDSYNMLIPTSNSAYNQYSDAREGLAIPRADILRASASGSDGNDYGFHPSMEGVRTLFNQGNLSVVGNVGALVAPTSKADYENGRVPLPPRLFSHNDQQDFWHSLKTDVPQPRGWAGRMADAMVDANRNSRLSMNISMSGRNLFQVGDNTSPYAMSSSGIVPMGGLNRSSRNAQEQRRIEAFDAMMKNSYDNVYANEFAKVKSRSEMLSTFVGDALSSVPSFTTPLPAENRIAQSLSTVAKMISSRSTLNMNRQIFFVGVGGWDTHSDQLSRQQGLLKSLSDALKYFYDLTVEMRLQDQITTFTAADFGRTLGSNGSGSDHGWGGHQLVMGGAVDGKKIFGEMPELVIGGAQDSGRGRLIPTTSIDQYAATLASWYGLSASDIADIFPNLGNFSNVNLGFV